MGGWVGGIDSKGSEEQIKRVTLDKERVGWVGGLLLTSSFCFFLCVLLGLCGVLLSSSFLLLFPISSFSLLSSPPAPCYSI